MSLPVMILTLGRAVAYEFAAATAALGGTAADETLPRDESFEGLLVTLSEEGTIRFEGIHLDDGVGHLLGLPGVAGVLTLLRDRQTEGASIEEGQGQTGKRRPAFFVSEKEVSSRPRRPEGSDPDSVRPRGSIPPRRNDRVCR